MFAELLVDLHLFEHEFFEHGVVAAAVGLGDLGAELALAAFEAAAFEGMEGVFDLGGECALLLVRRVLEDECKLGAGVVCGGGVEGIFGGRG